jgi:tripartite-type tricarboxylate transporter receptor subunit TctC
VPLSGRRPDRPDSARDRQSLSKKFNQNFIVENITGGGTIIATNRVAKASPGRLHATFAQSADFPPTPRYTRIYRSTPRKI